MEKTLRYQGFQVVLKTLDEFVDVGDLSGFDGISLELKPRNFLERDPILYFKGVSMGDHYDVEGRIAVDFARFLEKQGREGLAIMEENQGPDEVTARFRYALPHRSHYIGSIPGNIDFVKSPHQLSLRNSYNIGITETMWDHYTPETKVSLALSRDTGGNLEMIKRYYGELRGEFSER